jgi:hypothetical protein
MRSLQSTTQEVAMSRKYFTQAAALLAAAVTTAALFSAVAGLADGDREALFAAKNPPTLVAGHGAPVAG